MAKDDELDQKNLQGAQGNTGAKEGAEVNDTALDAENVMSHNNEETGVAKSTFVTRSTTPSVLRLSFTTE